MATWWTTFGAMLIPLALIFRIEGGEPSFVVYVLLVVGFLAMMMGWSYTWREMKREALQKKAFYELLLNIYAELKNIGGNKNERNNTTSRDPRNNL